jgi:RNA polymerase sigma factor (sigma-70 family)
MMVVRYVRKGALPARQIRLKVQRCGALAGLLGMAELRVTDPLELERVYLEHRLDLVRLAFLLTGSREDSEDVVQSAFATACERWREIEQPVPYLKRAVVNRANDLYRRRARERARPVVERPTEIPEVDETWAHVQRLPSHQRIVVVLRFYEDLPLVEIARLLSRPPATVRSDLRRALARLRKALK